MKKSFYILLFLLPLLLGSMAFLTNPVVPVSFRYDLKAPSEIYHVPPSLSEISGIDFFTPTVLVAVQDEKGRVYFYDLLTRTVTSELKFAKKGDYEDIQVVGKRIYALRSDGTIYRIKKVLDKKQKVKKYETFLKNKNDTEGLWYDKENNRLLVLCKEEASDKKKLEDHKAIYAFDLEEKEMSKKPVMAIAVEEVAQYLNRKFSGFVYKPSALAIHPVDGSIYIIDSVEKTLVQLSSSGDFLGCFLLPKHVLPQPEGITFDAEGNMYICTEASTTVGASICRFDLIPSLTE